MIRKEESKMTPRLLSRVTGRTELLWWGGWLLVERVVWKKVEEASSAPSPPSEWLGGSWLYNTVWGLRQIWRIFLFVLSGLEITFLKSLAILVELKNCKTEWVTKVKKSGLWTTANFKSSGKMAGINKRSWGIIGEIGEPRVFRISERSCIYQPVIDQSALWDIGDSLKLVNSI